MATGERVRLEPVTLLAAQLALRSGRRRNYQDAGLKRVHVIFMIL